MHIFTDSSVNQTLNKAVGAYTILNNLEDPINMKYIILESNSSTIAEMLTIRHVLNEIVKLNLMNDHNYLYTDCDNFVKLINKRQYDDKLKSHRRYELYKELIDLIMKLRITVIWTKGHSKLEDKTERYQQIFSIVDKFARNKLRESFNEPI
jgi:hypothetical protein